MAVTCPTCSRVCSESETHCFRCHTALRAETPSRRGQRSSRAVSWLVGLVLLVVVCAAVAGALEVLLGRTGGSTSSSGPRQKPPRAEYVEGFTRGCLKNKRNTEAFCTCAGGLFYDSYESLEELDQAVLDLKNGNNSPRIGQIISQCSN